MSFKLPSKKRIKAYWTDRLVELGKFDSAHELMEEDYCFACGFYYCKLPSMENTERAHILARCKRGSDGVDNLHLLCSACHRDSEFLEGDKYWKWFESRNAVDALLSHATMSGFQLSSLFR